MSNKTKWKAENDGQLAHIVMSDLIIGILTYGAKCAEYGKWSALAISARAAGKPGESSKLWMFAKTVQKQAEAKLRELSESYGGLE